MVIGDVIILPADYDESPEEDVAVAAAGER
jgi:hypothetical protein